MIRDPNAIPRRIEELLAASDAPSTTGRQFERLTVFAESYLILQPAAPGPPRAAHYGNRSADLADLASVVREVADRDYLAAFCWYHYYAPGGSVRQIRRLGLEAWSAAPGGWGWRAVTARVHRGAEVARAVCRERGLLVAASSRSARRGCVLDGTATDEEREWLGAGAQP